LENLSLRKVNQRKRKENLAFAFRLKTNASKI
jgi:hypothetical protein